jgi:hypothetical protein
MKSLTEIYKSLNDKPLHEDINDDAQWLLRGELPAGIEQGTITKDSWSSLPQYHNLVKHLANNQKSDTIDFPEYGGISFKLLDNEDIEWSIPSSKTYGDLSPEEWEAEREKMGMKTDDEGNRYLDREYDPGNEPLEIQHSETGITYFINVEDIEAYVSGEEVIAVDPDRGMDAIRVTRDETDVVGVSEEELEDFLVSGDRSADDSAVQERKSRLPWHNWVKKWWQNHHENPDGMNEQPRPDYADVDGDGDEEESMEKAFKDKEKMDEYGCSEQEIEEGTCGYGKNGKIGRKPAGPHLMRERFKKLAGIKKKKLNG